MAQFSQAMQRSTSYSWIPRSESGRSFRSSGYCIVKVGSNMWFHVILMPLRVVPTPSRMSDQ
ncbi:MAG: hypothetical protein L6R43_17005 [Planctomycetes bacterium]|nr:hypothetical protein [Planctomycetota bacterium]